MPLFLYICTGHTTLVRPQLEYASEAWNPHSITVTKMLEQASLQDPSPSCLHTCINYCYPCYILRQTRPQPEVCNSCCNYRLLQVLILPKSNKDLEPSARLSSQCNRNNQLQGGCSTLHQNDAAPCWFSHCISLLAWFLLALDLNWQVLCPHTIPAIHDTPCSYSPHDEEELHTKLAHAQCALLFAQARLTSFFIHKSASVTMLVVDWVFTHFICIFSHNVKPMSAIISACNFSITLISNSLYFHPDFDF